MACRSAGHLALLWASLLVSAPATEGANPSPIFLSNCCGEPSVPFGPAVPGDAPLGFGSQTDADCFAWWEFMALNWPTAAGAGFGDPGDQTNVQWEAYMSADMLFPPGGAKPPPWGTPASIPRATLAAVRRSGVNTRSVKVLHAISKFTAKDPRSRQLFASRPRTTSVLGTVVDPGIDEAAPFNGPNWLGAQNGTVVWFDVRVNQDEYNYVVDPSHQFYDANRQAAWVAATNPIVLPKGTPGTNQVGAIELKAAWMEAPNPQDPKWRRYKLSPGVVLDPIGGTNRVTTLALVGLHIIHKTQSQPTWIWATFEHIDNVPGNQKSNGPPFNFWNADCQASTFAVPTNCLSAGSTSPVTVSCTNNVPPPYYLAPGGPGPVPLQVSRVTPVDQDAQQANSNAWTAIAKAYPNSVWLNYQLVNVIWSSNPTPDPTTPQPVPLQPAAMAPPVKVANVVLETYAQNLTCINCHTFAHVPPTPTNPNPNLDSDFSFALGSATASTNANRGRRR